MRLVPYNREEHKCKNCYVWQSDGKKAMGIAMGTCQLHPAHVQFISIPQVDNRGNMAGMKVERVTGFPVMGENDTCYDHIPFPT